MKVALYRGISRVSKAIKFLTRSPYSHAAFLFDEGTQIAAERLRRERYDVAALTHVRPGSVIEAWEPGGVRNTPGLEWGHDPFTRVDVFALRRPLTTIEEQRLILYLAGEIGVPYGFWNVLRFVTKRPGNLDDTWFCSELVFDALSRVDRLLLSETLAWEVPPDWLARSRELVYEVSVTT